MKRLVLLFVVALASAAITYSLVGLRQPTLQNRGSDLGWIRAEFQLDDAQFAAVRQLHDDYSGLCAQHCADIVAARAALTALPPGATTDRAVAEQRVVDLEAICNDATRAHLRRVATAMPVTQGERFLRMVEPHLAQLPHDPAVRRDGLGR